MCFCETERKVILAADSSLSMTDVSKEIGIRWRVISDEDKAVCAERAVADKLRHEREVRTTVVDVPATPTVARGRHCPLNNPSRLSPPL